MHVRHAGRFQSIALSLRAAPSLNDAVAVGDVAMSAGALGTVVVRSALLPRVLQL